MFNPTIIKKITFEITYKTIALCLALSLIWSVSPFFGWSYYSLEGGLTSCSVEWSDSNWNVYSYNITVWIFAFIIPLIAIIYCNLHMLFIVNLIFIISNKTKLKIFHFLLSQFQVNNVSKVQNRKREKRIKRERRLTITVIVQIGKYSQLNIFNLI